MRILYPHTTSQSLPTRRVAWVLVVTIIIIIILLGVTITVVVILGGSMYRGKVVLLVLFCHRNGRARHGGGLQSHGVAMWGTGSCGCNRFDLRGGI